MGHPRHDHQVVEAYARAPVIVPARFCLVAVFHASRIHAAWPFAQPVGWRVNCLSLCVLFKQVPFVRAHEHVLKPIELLVLVSYTCCHASTPSLSTWSSSTALKGYLVLRGASRLDAFSGYPVRI